jgi:hypothetical protein
MHICPIEAEIFYGFLYIVFIVKEKHKREFLTQRNLVGSYTTRGALVSKTNTKEI